MIALQRLRITIMLCAMLAAVNPSFAWNPDEVLKDPALESRARSISAELRCLVCQNQSIDDSDADLARDLRLLVRERLVAGDTDDQVFQMLVSRYGEFVLLRPRLDLSTYLLWGLPALLLAGGACALVWNGRKSRFAKGLDELSESEKERLAKLIDAQ